MAVSSGAWVLEQGGTRCRARWRWIVAGTGMDGVVSGAVARGRLWRRKAVRGCVAWALELAAAWAWAQAMVSSR